eukprot:SAG25_NODE_6423_length_561_cov_0.610390_2_plen_64_part_01
MYGGLSHIRVDRLSEGGGAKLDTKRSVFVGNLPFDADEEQLRAHFERCVLCLMSFHALIDSNTL